MSRPPLCPVPGSSWSRGRRASLPGSTGLGRGYCTLAASQDGEHSSGPEQRSALENPQGRPRGSPHPTPDVVLTPIRSLVPPHGPLSPTVFCPFPRRTPLHSQNCRCGPLGPPPSAPTPPPPGGSPDPAPGAGELRRGPGRDKLGLFSLGASSQWGDSRNWHVYLCQLATSALRTSYGTGDVIIQRRPLSNDGSGDFSLLIHFYLLSVNCFY